MMEFDWVASAVVLVSETVDLWSGRSKIKNDVIRAAPMQAPAPSATNAGRTSDEAATGSK